jgi:hypothetical protein
MRIEVIDDRSSDCTPEQLARDITGNRVKVHRDQRTKDWRAFGSAAFDRVRQRVDVGAPLSRNQVR